MNSTELFQAVGHIVIWTPPWAISLAGFTLAIGLALFLHQLVFRLLIRFTNHLGPVQRSLLKQTSGPTRLGFVILAISTAADIVPVTAREAVVLHQVLIVCFIGLLGWIAETALDIWTNFYLRRFKLDAEDNLLARKHVTQTRILRRAADTLILLVAIGAALMTIDGVRQYGVSLLASAGVAGIVIGLALQPVLKNLIAGIQLAVTQPIRIDDALLVEGEWGNVEEITSTYVVIRIWDWRRLILPLSYFIEKPFQNWTREGSALIGTVMIYLDYIVPVADIRRKVEEIAAASLLWDRRVVNVQVTDFKDATMEIRILVSAATSGRTFDLRCEVREKLITYLQKAYPQALPRQRMEIAPQQADVEKAFAHGADLAR
jgi:small-conductance mechanosensitive channel